MLQPELEAREITITDDASICSKEAIEEVNAKEWIDDVKILRIEDERHENNERRSYVNVPP